MGGAAHRTWLSCLQPAFCQDPCLGIQESILHFHIRFICLLIFLSCLFVFLCRSFFFFPLPRHILCERGIRTFETSMRNTLDLAGVVMLHKMTHLPVVVDPSHACGHAWMVPELAKAAVAAGADGLMIEVHNNPAKAKCDGAQSLTPDQFDELMQFIGKEVEFFGKKLN